MIGEKQLAEELYEPTSEDMSNKVIRVDFAWCTGTTLSTYRTATWPPHRDTPKHSIYSLYSFGSAHQSGFQMAFCDGSVRVIDYDIDLRVHQANANRKDGTVGAY